MEKNRVSGVRASIAAALIGMVIAVSPAWPAENELRLTLQECFTRAMNENLDLKATSLGIRYQELSVLSARSAFDPSLSFRTSRAQSVSPNYTSYIPVNQISQKSTSANLSFGQNISTGGNWGFGAYNSLSESNVERIKNYSSYLSLSFNQPLLRGFGKQVTYSNIYLARLSGDTSIHTIENAAISLIAQVERSYWNFVYAREALSVKEMALAQADSLLVYNEKGRDLGLFMESDVAEARSAYLSRKQDVLEQENQIKVTEGDLKFLLNMASGETGAMRIVPVDQPSLPEISLDVDAAIKEAVQSRPDYLAALIGIEQNKIRLSVAKNDLLPGLDMNASYRLNGSGATYGKNLGKIGDADTYGWSLGLNLTYPLKNRNAKAGLERTEIDLNRAQLELDYLRNRIVTDIRSDVDKVSNNRDRIDVARQAVEANQLKLKAEQGKLVNHLSTNYIVLQYQTDLANSLNLYNRAIMDYVLSVLDLRQSKGTLLKDMHITIVPEGK
jgi:outer membrane protein